MSGGSNNRRAKIPHADAEIDLVPMIDCVFLILLFFMLCGHISTEARTEQITVPPTKTAAKFIDGGWKRQIINVFGNTQSGNPPRNSIKIGTKSFDAMGINDYTAYQGLRAVLDKVYDSAEKYKDPKGTPLMLPKVIIEIRADADTEYRVVQEIQQVVSDSIDPSDKMQPKKVDLATMRPFVNIDFTTRNPNDK